MEEKARAEKARADHESYFALAYRVYVDSLVANGVHDDEAYAAWAEEARANLEKRKKSGSETGIKLAERILYDPDASLHDRVRHWKANNHVPTFWEWDATINEEGLR